MTSSPIQIVAPRAPLIPTKSRQAYSSTSSQSSSLFSNNSSSPAFSAVSQPSNKGSSISRSLSNESLNSKSLIVTIKTDCSLDTMQTDFSERSFSSTNSAEPLRVMQNASLQDKCDKKYSRHSLKKCYYPPFPITNQHDVKEESFVKNEATFKTRIPLTKYRLTDFSNDLLSYIMTFLALPDFKEFRLTNKFAYNLYISFHNPVSALKDEILYIMDQAKTKNQKKNVLYTIQKATLMDFLFQIQRAPLSYPKDTKKNTDSKLAFIFSKEDLEYLRTLIRNNDTLNLFYDEQLIDIFEFYDYKLLPCHYFHIYFYLQDYRSFPEVKKRNYLRCAIFFGDIDWTNNLLKIPNYFDADLIFFSCDRSMSHLDTEYLNILAFSNYYKAYPEKAKNYILQLKEALMEKIELNFVSKTLSSISADLQAERIPKYNDIVKGMKICAQQTYTEIFDQFYQARACLTLSLMRAIELSTNEQWASDIIRYLNTEIKPLYLDKLPKLTEQWHEKVETKYTPSKELEDDAAIPWNNFILEKLNELALKEFKLFG